MGCRIVEVPRAAIEIIDDIASRHGVISRARLVETICEELETMWTEDCWEEQAKKVQLGTTGQISYAVDLYYSELEPLTGEQRLCRSVSEGALRLIGETVKAIGSADRIRLLDAICDGLEKKFRGKTLDYHLRQMNLCTTKDILYAIDIYKIGVEFKLFDLSA